MAITKSSMTARESNARTTMAKLSEWSVSYGCRQRTWLLKRKGGVNQAAIFIFLRPNCDDALLEGTYESLSQLSYVDPRRFQSWVRIPAIEPSGVANQRCA